MKSLCEDQEATLKDFTKHLEKFDIAYMLTGSMAMMRMTNDIDIVIDVYSSDAEKIINEFKTDFYVPHGRVREEDNDFQRLAFSNCRSQLFRL